MNGVVFDWLTDTLERPKAGRAEARR